MKSSAKNKNILVVFFMLVLVAIFFFIATGVISNMTKPAKQRNEVIVYVSHDQDYSEPILNDFQRETGIKVKAIYDTETTKTTGLVNRLLEERNNPQADVFWNNEVSRSIILKNNGVLQPYCSKNAEDIPSKYKDPNCYWTGFAARARILLANTQLLNKTEIPESITELINKKWYKKVALANPLFGTTGAHMAALFALWGNKTAEEFFRKLKENGLIIAESNSQVRELVANGVVPLGFTDTDDANAAVLNKKPVKVIFPDQKQGEIGTLIVPNTVMLIKGARHKENGKKLIDYLLSRKTEEKLAFSRAVQMPLHQNVTTPKNVFPVSKIKDMNVSWQKIAKILPYSQEFLKNLFIR